MVHGLAVAVVLVDPGRVQVQVDGGHPRHGDLSADADTPDAAAFRSRYRLP